MRNSANQSRKVSRSKVILTITVALLLLAGKGATAAIPAGPLDGEFIEMGNSGVLRGSVWGALAVTSDGDTLVNVNSRTRMLPASNLKLVTTGAALCRLGPDFRFVTSLARRGEIREGCLEGDLYIVGGGDPSLCDRYENTGDSLATFSAWREIISACGIRRIEGRVVGDSRYFDQDNIEGSWSVEDICDDYSSGVSGLSIGNNLTSPPDDSPLHCAGQFTDYLRENGIPVSLEASASPDCPQDSLILMGSTESVPLGSLISVTNHESVSIYAEALFRQLGRDLCGKSGYDASCEALYSVLGNLGMGAWLPEVRIVDGSGLSRKNCVSPEFLVSFLRMMSGRGEFGTYLASLPQPGSGTLKDRLMNLSPEMKSGVHMKSGSMTGVKCYSGYILPAEGHNGKMIVFSIMSNNVMASDSEIALLMDDLIGLLASEN